MLMPENEIFYKEFEPQINSTMHTELIVLWRLFDIFSDTPISGFRQAKCPGIWSGGESVGGSD